MQKEKLKEFKEFKESFDVTDAKMNLIFEMEPSRLEMVKGKRDFLKQTIILSAGIIAFAIPILDKGGIIKHQCIYNISLIGFIITIVSGMIYRYWLNKEEQNTYKNFVSFAIGIDLNKDAKSVLQNTVNGLNNIKKELPNPIKFHKYEKYIQLSLLIVFVTSLISMVTSVISIN